MQGEAVPETLAGGERVGPIHEVSDDEVLVTMPGVARVLVRGGAVAGIEPEPDADAGDVAWLVDGHVRGIVALQSGQLALRASGVVIDGRAVAICAQGAIGASAVAAGLANRGHAVLADGWLPVEVPSLRALAVTDELALWPDIAAMVGRDPESGSEVRPGLAKRRYRFARGETCPLAAVVVLQRYEWEDDVSVERTVGGSALENVLRYVAFHHLVASMGLEAQRFLWAAALASGCAVSLVELDRHRPGVDEPAEAIEKLLRG